MFISSSVKHFGFLLILRCVDFSALLFLALLNRPSKKSTDNMLEKKDLDELTVSSREFYERAHMKLSGSLIFGSLSMLFLGFTSAVRNL